MGGVMIKSGVKSKYIMPVRSYYRVTRLKGKKTTHLDHLDIGCCGDFSHCGHYSKEWDVIGSLREHEVTCKTCLKQLRSMEIYPARGGDE
jgi:hypothetical protein